MKPLKAWQILSQQECGRRIEAGSSCHEYLVDLARIWANHRFSTQDGRRFAYVDGSASILQRAKTLGLLLTPRERALLEKDGLAGAIVELGTISPPMLYGDFDTLKSDWLELHRSFCEPLTEEESTAFDVPISSDSEHERDEESDR